MWPFLRRDSYHPHILDSDFLREQGSILSESFVFRVEPHPVLAVGDSLRLALYDADYGEPLVVEAQVARDDGERGLWLGFTNAPSTTRMRIERRLKSLAPIESLSSPNGESQAVVMAEIVAPEPEGTAPPAESSRQ